jgi:hypothetical protein
MSGAAKIITLILILILLAAGTVLLLPEREEIVIANIYQNGKCIYSIDLSSVKEPYTIKLSGEHGSNDVLVEHGRIRVLEADCPDKTCVHQGWISKSGIPIVCLPNKLLIKIEKNSSEEDIDVLSR